MYRRGLTAGEAVARCRKAKNDAFWPRINFYRSLMRWQTRMKDHPPNKRSASV